MTDQSLFGIVRCIASQESSHSLSLVRVKGKAKRYLPERVWQTESRWLCRVKHKGKIDSATPLTNTMARTKNTSSKMLPDGTGKVLERLHYPLDVILLCVRWYVAYSLSLRNLEEMMLERGIEVDHSSVHRWVVKLVPLFEKSFRKRKRAVGRSWRVDETYVKVKGQWK